MDNYIFIFPYFDGFPKKVLFELYSYIVRKKKHLDISLMLAK